MDCNPPDSSVHGIFQAIILGCHVLLQGIFLIQGSNLHPWGLLHWQTDSLPLCHLGSLRLFKRVYSLERVLDSRHYTFSSHQHLGCIYILQRDEIKSLQMVIAAMKLKDTPWKESYDQPGQHIKKQRRYFANKDPSSQGYGFPSGHVWM